MDCAGIGLPAFFSSIAFAMAIASSSVFFGNVQGCLFADPAPAALARGFLVRLARPGFLALARRGFLAAAGFLDPAGSSVVGVLGFFAVAGLSGTDGILLKRAEAGLGCPQL
jgi:hypothetical protein